MWMQNLYVLPCSTSATVFFYFCQKAENHYGNFLFQQNFEPTSAGLLTDKVMYT